VVAEEILAAGKTQARAAPFTDSCGVGWYFMDLHPAVGNPRSMFAPTLPFQISMGALIPVRAVNLLAACKNIGVTHLSNGSYRLHPVEWNIGESAGALAAFCIGRGCTPARVWRTPELLHAHQRALLARGIPLAWTLDIPPADPLFAAAQMAVVHGGISPDSLRSRSLFVRPDDPAAPEDLRALLAAAQATGGSEPEMIGAPSWRTVVERLGV
jgi:hypothetical protein